MSLKNPQYQQERGSAIFYILIAVALFGAMGFVVSGMMRGSGSAESISDERQGIYAAEIISYAQQVRDTVKDIQISTDCEVEDISFENNFVSGYEHTPVATDECKIFTRAAYVEPNTDWLDASQSAAATYGEYVFTAATPIDGIGQDSGSGQGNDIAIVLNYVRDEICTGINDKAGITNVGNAPPIDAGTMDTTTKFTGTFAAANAIDAPETFGQPYGCVQNAGGTFNAFYYVLMGR